MPYLRCNCKHPYQDEKYGNYMRVHNPVLTKSGSQEYKCTVCNSIRTESLTTNKRRNK